MDVSKILAELKAEREQINEAILSLERLALGRRRGPGRPPSSVSVSNSSAVLGPDLPKRRGRPRGSKNKVSAEQRVLAASGGAQ